MGSSTSQGQDTSVVPSQAQPDQGSSAVGLPAHKPAAPGDSSAVDVDEFRQRLADKGMTAKDGRSPSKEVDEERSKAQSAAQQKAQAAEKAMRDKEAEATRIRDKGDACMGQQKFKEAIQHYTKSLQIDPNNSASYSGRGGAILRSSDKKPGDALGDLNKALEIDTQNMFALRDRAECKYKTGDYRGALVDYDRKLTLAPADGRALCGRAETKKKLGDQAGADADFKLSDKLGYRRQ